MPIGQVKKQEVTAAEAAKNNLKNAKGKEDIIANQFWKQTFPLEMKWGKKLLKHIYLETGDVQIEIGCIDINLIIILENKLPFFVIIV